jgi:hypothetical protein
MTSVITNYDVELVDKARVFLTAAAVNPASRAILERYGFDASEVERGTTLVADSERAFAAERAGTAWNFLARTPGARVAEARHWYVDKRRRWLRECFRRAEEEIGFVGAGAAAQRPLGAKLASAIVIAPRYAARALSPRVWREHRAERADNLRAARGDRPASAPPPKDTVLVELAGWYERWRLLAQRVFRDRPDLMAPFGLVPGKAPPRLRNKEARTKYGEKAAGSAVAVAVEVNDDDDAEADAPAPAAAAKKALPVVR